MASVHSFDVFDTALVRRVAFPSDVFRLIGRRIAREISEANQEQFIEDFLAARLRAERTARQPLSISEECTLDQIWGELQKLLPHLPSTCGPEYELDAERAVLCPNGIVTERIRKLRNQGMRTIFISDTYLPVSFVRDELLRHEVAEETDGFYVSSTFGACKWTGALFSEILKRERIAPQELHHYGDNIESDLKVPQKLGIGATLLSDTRPNKWEQAFSTNRPILRDAFSTMSGSMRAFRLSTSQQVSEDSRDLVATFLGPVLMAWAAWVLSTARRDGIKRLYFVARDAYLLFRVAKKLAPLFGDFDCRYLKISRQSILLAATEEISPSGIPWLKEMSRTPRIERLLQSLGLSWSEVGQDFSSLAGDEGRSKIVATDDEWIEFWKIVQSTPISTLLHAHIRKQKNNALIYLQREGLRDNLSSAVIDIGWRLIVQTHLQQLLGGSDRHNAPVGYYLGLTCGRMQPSAAGKSRALFFEEAPDFRPASARYEIFRRTVMLEHVLGLAPHGTVREYSCAGPTIAPVCDTVSEEAAEHVNRIEQAVDAFCERWRYQAIEYADEATAREMIEILLKTWCATPSKSALNALKQVSVNDPLFDLDARPLLDPWQIPDAMKILIPRRLHSPLALRIRSRTWPEASRQLSGALASAILRFRNRYYNNLY